ncbi:MAG: GNAT family N-acetyltransferase [Blastocatellia bacterium]
MITIRPEQPEDITAIHHVVKQAFERAEEAELVDLLRRNGKATLSLVADDNGRVVGHLLFSPVVIETGHGPLHGVGLAPLAVAPERQNEGIGSNLVRQGLLECRRLGHPYAIVLGHPEYYPRFGFAAASQYGIKNTYNARDEAFMAIELMSDALLDAAGMANYQPEFELV